MSAGRFLGLLRRAVARAFHDNCFGIAKGVAFSAILSFFPGLMVVAGILFSQDVGGIVRELSDAMARVLPPDAHRLATQFLFGVDGASQGLLIGAAVVAVWSASGAVLSLTQGLQAAYQAPESRGMLWGRVVALLLVLLAGMPLLGATLLLLFGSQIEAWLLAHLDSARGPVALAGRALRWGLALGASVTVTAVLYQFGPKRRQRWRYVWPGALLTTALWLAATLAFGWYVQHLARYRDFYGSISAVAVLLIWMYILSLIVLVGCEFNAEYEKSSRRK